MWSRLAEAELMAGGMSYEAAHEAALARFGVSRFSVYPEEVLTALPEGTFNENWFAFWRGR